MYKHKIPAYAQCFDHLNSTSVLLKNEIHILKLLAMLSGKFTELIYVIVQGILNL